MNLWAIKANGKYAGGMAIVAAKNKEKAIELASKINSFFVVHYHKPYSAEIIGQVKSKEEKVLDSFELGE